MQAGAEWAAASQLKSWRESSPEPERFRNDFNRFGRSHVVLAADLVRMASSLHRRICVAESEISLRRGDLEF